MANIITYIDGFNLYHGIKSEYGRKYLWLDLEAMSESLIKPDDDLLITKYFTSRVTNNPSSEKRQKTYIEALDHFANIDIFYGRFQVLQNQLICGNCGTTSDITNEKMTDVQIATQLLTDAFTNKFDVAILITGDTDLIPAIQAVKLHHPQKSIGIYFPPHRHSMELKRHADFSGVIGEIKLRDNQLPEHITKPNGYVLKKPSKWV